MGTTARHLAYGERAPDRPIEGRLRRIVHDLGAAIIFALLVAAGFCLPFVG